jgi:hypothetical protein
VSCSLVLVSENTSRLNNVLSTSLTPRDLLRVPKRNIRYECLMVMVNGYESSSYKGKEW